MADPVEAEPACFEQGFRILRHLDEDWLACGRIRGHFFPDKMPRHDFQIPVSFKHRVCFTRDAFAPDNSLVGELLTEGGGRRVLVLVEENVAHACTGLTQRIESYFADLGFDWRGLYVLP